MWDWLEKIQRVADQQMFTKKLNSFCLGLSTRPVSEISPGLSKPKVFSSHYFVVMRFLRGYHKNLMCWSIVSFHFLHPVAFVFNSFKSSLISVVEYLYCTCVLACRVQHTFVLQKALHERVPRPRQKLLPAR